MWIRPDSVLRKEKVVGRKNWKWSMLFLEKVFGMQLRSYSRNKFKCKYCVLYIDI